MTEKIMARASEKQQVRPGDNIWTNVDILMTHDVCGPGSIGIFKKEFGEDAKVVIILIICIILEFFYFWWLAAICENCFMWLDWLMNRVVEIDFR
jgi:3-isopropylmalate/(R)-2-methylmalate dehydratase large subunit